MPRLSPSWIHVNDKQEDDVTSADISSVSLFGVTAEHQSLDDICDIGPLIDRDFVFSTEIAPVKPIITEDLKEPVIAGGMIGVLERRKDDLYRTA